ncbi:hypothetical protein MPSEU_000237000 [Mayamaea pseudoterrestris]|nr:hypothetical protein MPSEU_000237000 [Mayamaea pseudoterrestris]
MPLDQTLKLHSLVAASGQGAPPAPFASAKRCRGNRKRQRARTTSSWVWGAAILASFVQGVVAASSSLTCNKTSECLNQDFTCQDYICVNQSSSSDRNTSIIEPKNPFAKGCLHYHNVSAQQIRVCNSDDDMDHAVSQGICRPSAFDYMEIRMLSNNWESAVFETWILQIILSELLDVPTTTETAKADAKINFYDAEARFEFGAPTDLNATRTANEIKDCRLANRNADHYEPCAHVITELWEAHEAWQISNEGSAEIPTGLGVLGEEGWFVPKFTGEKDPSLLSYLGIQGQDNRRKLAETFKRPTSWADYCRIVSSDGCMTPNNVAKRPPRIEERQMYHSPGVYTGHFRATEKNDCDKWPLNCTGHFVDYPCGWSSYSEQIAYHLDIAFESNGRQPGSGGYTYDQMVQIWLAANETKSHVAMMWWSPGTLYQSFVRTDAEFTRINLPPPTQACENARVETDDRCSASQVTRVGNAAGACDETVKPLYKIVTRSLLASTYDSGIPVPLESPAYESIKLFQISGTQLGEIMTMAINSESPREGVCRWFVENMEYAAHAIPATYPRVLQIGEQSDGLRKASSIFSATATILSVFSLVTVICQRKRRVMVFAQVEFLYLILAGLLAVSLGAVMSAIPPSQVTCILIIWFVNLGYSLQLVPLIAKVGAINRLLNAVTSMKRVVVRRKSLYSAVTCISLLVCGFLLAWTLTDPPVKQNDYEPTNTTVGGKTLVIATSYCTSDRSAWMIASLAWMAILLVCATVLAFQNRNLRQDFNESQTLGLMIYSQFVFVVLRIIMYFYLPGVINESTLRLWFSMLFSTDTIATIMIYFVPKFVAADESVTATSAPTRQGSTPSGTGWWSFLSRSQVEQQQDSVLYNDRRMRSELPESEFVRDDGSRELGDVISSHANEDDEVSDGDCESISSVEKQLSNSGLRQRRTCVHCGEDCGEDPDTVDNSEDSFSPPS